MFNQYVETIVGAPLDICDDPEPQVTKRADCSRLLDTFPLLMMPAPWQGFAGGRTSYRWRCLRLGLRVAQVLALTTRTAPGLKVEQFSEDGFLLVVAVPLLVLVVAVVLAAMPAELGGHWLLLVVGGLMLRRHWRGMLDRGRRLRSRRPLDDLVEFAAVKPHAPALGTIVDFDAAAFRHNQGYIAMRAIHENLRVCRLFR